MTSAATVLGHGPATKAGLVVVPLALGGGLGAAAPWLLEQALRLPWVPWEGRLRLVASVPEPWLQVGLLVAGLALGAAFVLAVVHDSLVVEVDDDRVRWRLQGAERVWEKPDVAAAFRDGRDLVLISPAGHDLVRGRPEAAAEAVAEAFTRHGWPWTDGRPVRPPVDLRKDDHGAPRWTGTQ